MTLRLSLLVLLTALAALLPLGGVSAAHQRSPKVVASGLDNPRGLDVARDGAVYVTEAGTGGDPEVGPCVSPPPGEEGPPFCVGETGAVTKISHGRQRRVLTGLPSVAPPGGEGASGPQDIALRRFGGAWLVVGLGADPAAREELGELGGRLGWLYRVSRFGRVRPVADIAGFEADENPDGFVPDSNPNSVLSHRGRRIVADAGGNDLLRVGRNGRISVLAVFPFRGEMEPVPTAVVVGPDGAFYVSELTGFPFPPGEARVYRVVPGQDPEVFAEGFTNATDLAFGRDGSLYVLEFAANGILNGGPGALIRVRPDGSRETVASEGLEAPTGLAISRKGDIYISNRGDAADVGEVLRIRHRSHHR